MSCPIGTIGTTGTTGTRVSVDYFSTRLKICNVKDQNDSNGQFILNFK